MQAAIADGATHPLLPVVADLRMHKAELTSIDCSSAHTTLIWSHITSSSNCSPTISAQWKRVAWPHSRCMTCFITCGKNLPEGCRVCSAQKVKTALLIFWARARATPNWKDHPAADHSIPLLCFAEGVDFSKQKSMSSSCGILCCQYLAQAVLFGI